MHVLSKLFGLTLLFIVIFGTTSNGQTTINIISTGDAGPSSGTNWSISGTTLTATGTANIQASVIETALSSGDLTVVSATGSEYRIQVSDPIDYTGATERTLTFGATHQILVYQDISSTSAPLNVIIASEFDRTTNFTSTGEGVGLINSAITTNGGDVWIGGGALTGSWNGHTVGVGAAMAGPNNGIGVDISGSSISTAGGDVRILGTSKTRYTNEGPWVNSEGGISAFSAGATINSGAGDIELISDIMGFDWPGNTYNNYSSSQGEIQIDGTGTLTIAPLESSFANAVTWDATESGGYYTSTGGGNTIDGLKIKNTLGLTIGKSSNTVDVTIATAIAVDGSITVYGGNVTVNGSLTCNGGTERTFTVGAIDRLIVNQTITSSTAPINIILASEIDRASGFTGAGYGVGVFSNITTNGGDIWIGGGQLTGSWNGHKVGVGAAMGGITNGVGIEISNVTISTGGGDVRILGTSNGLPGINAYQGNSTINAGAGNIELISDRMGFDYSGSSGEIQIDGTGTLALAPLESSFANAVTWDATESGGYYTSTGGGNTIDGLKIKNTLGLTIGKSSNTVDVTIASAVDIAGPIKVYGGDIDVNANLTSTVTNADIVLKASGTIIIHDNTGIETNGGNLILWSNSDNTNGGNVLTGQNVTLDSRQGGASTGGGHIHIAGGADSNADGFPDDATAGIGNFTGGSAYGILFGNAAPSGVQLLSGGGNITLIGGVDGNFNSGANSHGIGFYPGYTVDAGAGSISFTGYANSGGVTTIGIDLMTFGAQNASSITTTGGLTFNGVTTVANGGGNHGIIINTGLTLDAGTVDVTGDSDDANIILNGSVVSDGAIQFKADLYSFSSGSISGQGTVSIEPLTSSSSFSSAFSNSGLTLGSALTGLTIGKSTNTADVTIGGATSIAGPITLYGGALALNAALTATNDDINLHASGAVTQSAALTASGLGLHGAGTFTLTNTSNNVVTIAGGDNTTKLGNVSCVDASGGLEIGIVNPTGIYSTGPVLIETLDGNITLAKEITTDDGSADAIILNAGKSAAIGTATGGDIVVSGSPVLTTGAGGIVKLFSGSHENSTGLTSLVGGSSNTRTSVDETTVTFSPVLSADNAYALYRVESASLLPVELLGIQSRCLENDQVELTWQTASELNADYFNVMRSADGYTWDKIGTVAANGTTNELSTYVFTDYERSANSGNYYRLHQVDYDGQSEWLPIITSNCSTEAIAMNLYPNPASYLAVLEFDMEFKGTVTLEFINNLGRIAHTQVVNVQPGFNRHYLDLNPLTAGLYQLVMNVPGQKPSMLKLLVAQ